MAIHGYLWISMEIHGNPWKTMEIHGSPWISMEVHGYPWISMDIHGSPWISMDIYGNPWISMEIHGYPSMEVHGNPWKSMEIHGKFQQALKMAENREKTTFCVFLLFTPLYRRFRLPRVATRELFEIYRLVSKILHFTPCGSVFGRFCVLCKNLLTFVSNPFPSFPSSLSLARRNARSD